LSVPHGAVNFAVLEFVRKQLALIVESHPKLRPNADRIGPGLDFLSSAISTIACSVVSTPQMMITDNIMAGNYRNLPSAARGLAQQWGVSGFYRGWWPGLVGKIPSYALTWTIFQRLKHIRNEMSDLPATDLENTIMGCIASATTVCIMIPMDTIKTRLVTQMASPVGGQAYKGIIDCAIRVAKEEGFSTFYRGLPPRLVSVVPMIGIQFGVYEFMKKAMTERKAFGVRFLLEEEEEEQDEYEREGILQEAAMEVAASPEHPFPAPMFLKRVKKAREHGIKKIKNRLMTK
jgi:solute carrier family 25 S-adenosylmethionine transporter 26